MANQKITELAAAATLDGSELLAIVQPVTDPADNKKLTVDALTSHIASSVLAQKWKSPEANAATTAALPTNTQVGVTLVASANGALPAQDGITLVLNDSLLVKDEVSLPKNGLYTLTQVGDGGNPWILTRRADSDNGDELDSATVPVAQGTINGDTTWRQINDNVNIGVSDVVWQNILGSPLPDWSESTKGKVEAADQTESEAAASAALSSGADVTKGTSLRSLWWFWAKIKTLAQTISGVWTAPKANLGTNTAQLATCDFVQDEIGKVYTDNITGAVSIDLSTARVFILTLVGNVTSFTFTNEVVGKAYVFVFIQSTTAKTLTWTASKFRAPFGTMPILTDPTTNGTAGPANSRDIITALCTTAGRLDLVLTPDLINN